MDGKGRWMDNVFIERLWRSVKYEEIYINEHATIPALHARLEWWFGRYNNWRPHQTHGNLTPAVSSTKQASDSPRAILNRLSAKPHEAGRVGHKPQDI